MPPSPKRQRRPLTPRLRLGIDFGTKTLSICWQFIYPGTTSAPSRIEPIEFENDSLEMDMAVAYVRGRLIWGAALSRQLDDGILDESSVIRLFKLLLYPKAETQNVAHDVMPKLRSAGKTVDELLSDCLRAFIEFAVEQIATHPIANLNSEEHRIIDIRITPIDLYLSVPRMWTFEGCQRMSQAAKSSGVACSRLVYEPECAAASILSHRFFEDGTQWAQALKPGTIILVADCGGGTVDIVSFRVVGPVDPSAKAKLKLEVVGTPDGFLCGSTFINTEFKKWLENRWRDEKGRGMLQVAASLGVSAETFLTKASLQFDNFKSAFPNRGSYRFRLDRPLDAPRTNAKDRSVMIEWDEHTMQSFFDRPVDNIHEAIEKNVDPHTSFMILPGGFGKSRYLSGSLRDRYYYQERTFYNSDTTSGDNLAGDVRSKMPTPIVVVDFPRSCTTPVARGALLRYDNLDIKDVKSTWNIGIALVEEFDPRHHPDATTGEEDSPEYQNIFNYVKWDPQDDSMKIVEKRWRTLMPKGASRNNRRPFRQQDWELRFAPVGKVDKWKMDVYCTRNLIRNHAPIVNNDGTLRPGIEKICTITKMFDPSSFVDVAWPVIVNSQDEEVHPVYCRIAVICEGANMEFGWEVCPPEVDPINGDKNSRKRKRGMFSLPNPDSNMTLSRAELSSDAHPMGVEEIR